LFTTAIFDMDGLLIDSERIIMQACIAAASEFGIVYTLADYVELIGRAAPDANRLMTEQLGGEGNYDKVIARTNALLASQQHHFPLKNGALQLLGFLQSRNIACGVASSSYVPEIQHRLTNVGVLGYFQMITGGNEVLRGKPDPAIYQLTMQKFGMLPHEGIVFEDSESGARAAIAAGLNVVVVPDLKQPSAFVRDNCFKVLDSLEDTTEFLEEWF
jgi:beta-phosphoglucomutase-like phosphatase (HAD superfamily)